ncbi:MAG TPA: hypothetical protein VK698_19295 [Kofleriaceae bacterium]|nr:hypothetical protein [Kofleriaceae bacterium]
MTLRITFDVFSGRPNPVVVVTGAEEKDLLRRLAPARGRARRGQVRDFPESTLGYRGLIIERIESDTRRQGPAVRPTRTVRVVDGTVRSGKGVSLAADPGVEDYVCGSTGPARLTGLGRDFCERLVSELLRHRDLIQRIEWPPTIHWPQRSTCPCAPDWEPSWWNDAGPVQFGNNCYNYGTDYRSDTFAQPGLASGAMYASITCAEVRAGAVADALIASPKANNKCPKQGHLVALVVGPRWDFHWYRKQRNGRWTHKPGRSPATNLDDSGHVIMDPRAADRGGYTDFCTFMVVMHGHVRIR